MNAKRKMFFKMLFSSLLRRRSRIIIALLSIIVGATILSGLVTIYIDVPRQMSSQFRNYGANVVFSSSDDSYISQEEITTALNKVPSGSVKGYTAYRYENTNVNNVPVTIAGIDFSSVKKTSPYWNVNGSYPEATDEVLIGANVASTFSLSVGSEISMVTEKTVTAEIEAQIDEDSINPIDIVTTVDEVKYVKRTLTLKIAGIVETGGSEENYIYATYDDVEKITFEKRDFDIVDVSISATSDTLSQYVDKINDSGVGVNASLVKRLIESEAVVLKKLQSLVFIVTAVILVLTMICVATTMTAVVAERRKEIGIRKSIGASNKDIVSEFVFEGLVLGAVGGIFGSILGYVFALVVSLNVFSSAITFRPLLVPITIIAAIIITILSFLIPIRTAVKIEPALVLKGE